MLLTSDIYYEHLDDDGSEEEEEEPEEDDEVDNDDVNGKSEEDEGDELEDDEDEPPEPNPKAVVAVIEGKMPVMKKNVVGDIIAKKRPVADLVNEAIKQLNERSGSSLVAIKRFIIANQPDMDERRLSLLIKRHCQKSIENGTMALVKRSFKLTKKLEEEQKKLAKQREKARKEKQKEKEKEKKKEKQEKVAVNLEKAKNENTKKKMIEEGKDKAKKANKQSAQNGAKNKQEKNLKNDKETSKTVAAQTATAKPKLRVKSRKSINLLVKPTAPRPKAMKKSNSLDTGKQNSVPTKTTAGTSKVAAATTGKGKKPKAG